MWLNVRSRFRGPPVENRAFHFLALDSALLFILILNCVLSITALIYCMIHHQELMNLKCYFRIFTPILFVLQFIPIFWMFANDSSKAAFIALYSEVVGTIALISGNLAFCSLDWKYEAAVLYLPRCLSLYVFTKALVFYSYQEQMIAVNDTDTETTSVENDEELNLVS